MIHSLGEAFANADVAAAMARAGWSPERRVDTARWRQWFEREGYGSNQTVDEILVSVGGLVVTPLRRDGAAFASGTINFDPEWAATGEHDRIVLREAQLGQRLWPLGEWSDTYILLYGETGAVFAESSEYGVLSLGDDFASALNTLITADVKPAQIIS